MITKLWQDPHFRIFYYCLFAFYSMMGLFATFWISDEFDSVRLTVISFVTVPCLCGFLAGFIADRNYWRNWPQFFVATQAIVVVTLLWSHWLLLNAVCGSKNSIVSSAYHSLAVNTAVKKGAFNHLYQTRW